MYLRCIFSACAPTLPRSKSVTETKVRGGEEVDADLIGEQVYARNSCS